MLAARNRGDLKLVTDEINANGGRAIAVETDVADEAAVTRLGEAALLEFGTVDTWVNNAGLSIYGKLTEVPLADKRKLFDINFWGVVHGCRTAIRLMKHRGGVLINIGSEVSDVAIPLQGIYSASKHAVKGYTDALRMELEHDRIPIAVTLVKPSAINTPYPEHARNYLEDGVPALPPPLYAPEVVARGDPALRGAPGPRHHRRRRRPDAGRDGDDRAAPDRQVPETRDVRSAEDARPDAAARREPRSPAA